MKGSSRYCTGNSTVIYERRMHSGCSKFQNKMPTSHERPRPPLHENLAAAEAAKVLTVICRRADGYHESARAAAAAAAASKSGALPAGVRARGAQMETGDSSLLPSYPLSAALSSVTGEVAAMLHRSIIGFSVEVIFDEILRGKA